MIGRTNSTFGGGTAPDGATVTPINDISILLKCAGINGKNYTTMAQLLNDSDAIEDVTMSENAMKYLARSTDFADEVCANETFMTFLGQSPYVDDTVLNSDIWVTTIGNSTYWRQVSKTVTLYGGASESITVDGNTLVTTNSDGSVTTSVPYGTHTYKGSVSGQSFSRTVTKYTTDVKVMPEGSLYWYGNDNTTITGGFTARAYSNQDYTSKFSYSSQYLYITNTIQDASLPIDSNKKIALTNYTKINMRATKTNSETNGWIGIDVFNDHLNYRDTSYGNKIVSYINKTNNFDKDIFSLDISSINTEYYIGFSAWGTYEVKIHEIWLE